ncbi:hypothetical protein BJ742DRAFT_814337 [Cladochytrium replicatum]|nr:hypothetical protein BJ742DRAFT_814337 [Cladochytrium replicatum]
MAYYSPSPLSVIGFLVVTFIICGCCWACCRQCAPDSNKASVTTRPQVTTANPGVPTIQPGVTPQGTEGLPEYREMATFPPSYSEMTTVVVEVPAATAIAPTAPTVDQQSRT